MHNCLIMQYNSRDDGWWLYQPSFLSRQQRRIAMTKEIVHELPTHRSFTNLTGQKFGNLIVLGFSGYIKSGAKNRAHWLCECECGNKSSVRSDSLTSGKTTSCGCVQKKAATNHDIVDGKPATSHPLFGVYSNMNRRCYEKNVESYVRYGAPVSYTHLTLPTIYSV